MPAPEGSGTASLWRRVVLVAASDSRVSPPAASIVRERLCAVQGTALCGSSAGEGGKAGEWGAVPFLYAWAV